MAVTTARSRKHGRKAKGGDWIEFRRLDSRGVALVGVAHGYLQGWVLVVQIRARRWWLVVVGLGCL